VLIILAESGDPERYAPGPSDRMLHDRYELGYAFARILMSLAGPAGITRRLI